MKTTLDLDDRLLTEAKKRAAAAGKTLTAFVEDALRGSLLPPARPRRRFTLELPVVRGTAPPATEVMDRRALYDFLNQPE